MALTLRSVFGFCAALAAPHRLILRVTILHAGHAGLLRIGTHRYIVATICPRNALSPDACNGALTLFKRGQVYSVGTFKVEELAWRRRKFWGAPTLLLAKRVEATGRKLCKLG